MYMNPAQKKANDRLISIISLGLLVPFVIVVGYFLVEEIRISSEVSYVEPVPVLRDMPLSEEEIEAERSKLPINTITSIDVSVNGTNEGSGTSKLLSQAELEDFMASKVPADIKTEVEMVSFSDSLVFTGVEISYPNDDLTTTQVLQGTLADVAIDYSALIVVPPNAPAVQVLLTRNSQILINGGRILPENLEIGDTLRVEGTGTKEIIDAKVISIIRNYETLITN